MLPVYDLSTPSGRDAFEACLAKLRATASLTDDQAQVAAKIVEAVRRNGDGELVRQMQKWSDPDFTAGRIRVDGSELAAANKTLTGPLRAAIETSIEHVRQYQSHIMPAPPTPVVIDGAELGMRLTCVDSAGLTVPGGAAVLFSTIVMLAVPAQVAGVPADRISVVNPPPTLQGDEPVGYISPIVLGVCSMLGIERVYRIGGAAAVAALAYGTETVEPVDLIAGPGNVYVQLAKQIVAGRCGTDGGFYGPSEIVTIADDDADPACIAADLIAQAEHDPGKCFLVAWSAKVIERVRAQIDLQLRSCKRQHAIEAALTNESCAVVATDRSHAVEVANTIAAEHVNLAVADPDQMLGQIRHAGEVFLGDQTPVAAGDYFAGPSHCLPTATTARFGSGVSVYTFIKRTGTVCYRNGMSPTTIAAIAQLAEAEGLDGHAASARARRPSG
jgi:histidinol dehydrogenase